MYREPSPLLKRLFLPPKPPSLTLSPNYTWLLLCQEPPLPSIQEISQPEEKLAGLRFHPSTLTPSRLQLGASLTLKHLTTGAEAKVDLPPESEGVRYACFHPERDLFVFSSKLKGKPFFELYKCEFVSGHWETDKITALENRRMNFIQGCPYQFTPDGSKLLIRVVPHNWPENPPSPPEVSTGPVIQFVGKDAKKAPGRTYQDLLKNSFDEEKLRYFITTELLCVDVDKWTASAFKRGGGVNGTFPQIEGGKLIQKIQCSPSGRFLLVHLTTQFSYSVPLQRFGKDVHVWDLESEQFVEVASLPVDDEIPLSHDACSRHPRAFHFHPCEDHTIIFVEAVDGGDPENAAVDGERDVLYTRQVLIDDEIENSTLRLGGKMKLIGLEWRFSDLEFCESGLGVVDSYRWKDRMVRKWIFQHPNTSGNGGSGIDASGSRKRLLWERTWEDRYTDPGEPLTRRGKCGQYFIVQPTPTSIYIKGAGASGCGDRPFLDILEFGSSNSIETRRLWRCAVPVEVKDEELDPTKEVGGVLPTERKDVYETLVVLMPDNDSVLISRESKTSPRNYYLTKLSDAVSEAQVTQFEHPQPDLLGITKELVRYQREDGVELTANLYLPPGYDGKPRPTLFWAYPREFKDSKAAGQVKSSKHKFVSASWASPIHWAARGWVIMDDFALPVVGEGDAHPNDTFIEQIVMGATAAVNYAKSRGVCDTNRCAVGGHSYGSFMTSHLLSHTSLFAAGIGRSGAFNRTLTPMSFQQEDRSIWEAPDTYISMSPLMHVKKYSEQERVGKLLLIHGEADENSGTYPMQSERYFAALKAFGIESRLVMLPLEGHSYRARESILHMAWEQEEWLKSLEDDLAG